MSTASSSDPAFLSKGSAKFTSSIFKIIHSKTGNLFFSPISIEAVLALAHAGAGGNTAAQIQAAAHLPDTREASALIFGQLVDQLSSDSNVNLSFANALYADHEFQIKPDYLSLVEKDFKAKLGQVDFKDSEKATNEINGWVASKTNNKIAELFSQGVLDRATKAVLLNAIYFKGNWEKKFPTSATKKGLFYLNEKDTKEVDFMSIKAKFRFAEELGSYIVEIPYQGESVSMVVVAPKEKGTLPLLETQLLDADIAEFLKNGRNQEIVLTMPKFKLEESMDLNETLQKLGITDLFSDKDADLSGISDVPLVVSKVVHKSFIEVNEEGTEAAAATGLVAMVMSLPPPPIRLTLDQPFLFYLVHKATGAKLFMGRLAAP